MAFLRMNMSSLDYLEYKELSTEALDIMKIKNSHVKVKLNNKQATILSHFSLRLLEAELFDAKSKSVISKFMQVIYSAYYVLKALIFYPNIIELQTFLTMNPPSRAICHKHKYTVSFEFIYAHKYN